MSTSTKCSIIEFDKILDCSHIINNPGPDFTVCSNIALINYFRNDIKNENNSLLKVISFNNNSQGEKIAEYLSIRRMGGAEFVNYFYRNTDKLDSEIGLSVPARNALKEYLTSRYDVYSTDATISM